MKCIAYCTAASYDISGLYNALHSQYKCTMFRETLHVEYLIDEERQIDAFYFPYGSSVYWESGECEELQLLEDAKKFQLNPNEVIEEDHFDYQYGNKIKVEDELIILPDYDILTKLAISHGLAQSVKLGAFEDTIGKAFKGTRHIPEDLANKGRINLSRKQIRKEMGLLFLERSSINLHVDVLDTPDFFWDYPELESFYLITANELDLETRTEVLNHRLDVLKELFEMLGNELNHQHSSRLEWIIIWLIVIEVLFTLFHDIFKVI